MSNFQTDRSSSAYDGSNTRFDVLVVEDDPASREEYLEFLTSLGYSSRAVSHGAEAIKAIASTPSIGIVVTDLDMPTMDGLSLLNELQTRFTPFRPLVPIVVTGMNTVETAVEAMRSDAIDFLPKPVPPAEFAAALRRASARWTILHGQFRLLSLMELGNSLTIQSPTMANTPSDRQNPSREVLQKFVRSILKARQQRAEFMDASKFADPAWDIMLDLTSAALEGRSVPALSVSVAANVPMTTALRYVKRLVEDGVVKRWDDPGDKRRSLLALENHALESMIQYLTTVWRITYAEGTVVS
jgi:CheY-like chemotaxis protein